MDNSDIRILVVDDEEMIRRNITGYLEDEGYTVSSSSSGESALQLVEDNDYDIAIIDIRLTGMDGDELIRKIHEKRTDIRYLICTGSTNFVLYDDLVKCGVNQEDIILKPVNNMSVFVEKIEEKIKMKK